MERIARAADLAASLDTPQRRAPDGRARRFFAMGDPQTRLERVLEVLDRHGLLGDDGWLKPDAGLVSIGDHFDYGEDEGPAQAAVHGERLLTWLASHPADQVVLLAGNHDVARVSELAHETDESFARARALAGALRAREPEERQAAFAAEFRHIPTPEIAARDYSTFTEKQRRLVQQLLASKRMRLAHVAALQSGEEALLTHAAVGTRELRLLGLVAAIPRLTAAALNRHLDAAVEKVADRWEAGERVALDLSPLHVAGVSGREGGGLLYHRPAHPDRPRADKAWEFFPPAPRRFDPRTLPLGLVQLCGHSGHKKLVEELGEWVAESAKAFARGGLRTLRTDGREVRYEGEVVPSRPGEATVYFIDGEMNHVPPEQYRLFPLG